MIKLVISGALCASTVLISYEMYGERIRIADSVNELAEVTAVIISLLRYEAADVYTVCREAFDGAVLSDYSAFKAIQSGDFPREWSRACKNLKSEPEAAKLFERIGRVLGSCDLESQIERLLDIRSELCSRAEYLKSKNESVKKLYTALGALSGIAISIIAV